MPIRVKKMITESFRRLIPVLFQDSFSSFHSAAAGVLAANMQICRPSVSLHFLTLKIIFGKRNQQMKNF
jgi:hypothetical protein